MDSHPKTFFYLSQKKFLLSKNKIGPDSRSDFDKGLITVMALPPREAAELFLAMYR